MSGHGEVSLLVGLLAVGAGDFLNILAGFLGTYSSFLVAVPSLKRRGRAYFYLNLIGHALLKPMGGLPLSE